MTDRKLEKPVDVPSSFEVTVRLPDGSTKRVDGRVGRLIAWMLDERSRIEGMPFGWVGFNLTPTSFQPEIRRTWEHIKVRPNPE